jgi:hypothetical protein
MVRWGSIKLERRLRWNRVAKQSRSDNMMSQTTSRKGTSQVFRYLVAVLCVLLILFVGVAQVLHTHTANEAANAGCSLCAVAHVSVVPAPVLATPVVAEVVLPVAQPEAVSAPQRFFAFSLYVRPPPAATTLS